MRKSEAGREVMSQEERSRQTSGQSGPMRGLRGLVWQVPLGWQLSTLYTLVLVITLALVGSLVYSQQESFLVTDVAQRLEQNAAHIVSIPALSRSDGDGHADATPRPVQAMPTPHPTTVAESTESQDRLIGNLVRGLSGPDVTIAVISNQGEVITSTLGLEGDSAPVVDPVTSDQATSALNGNSPLQWIITRADSSRRVVVLMALTARSPAPPNIVQPGSVTLLVEQSASLAAVDAALGRLGTYLLLGVVGGTVVGVILLLLFTRGVLRPLDRVVDTAEAISEGDLQRRLELPQGRNEVARLGKAFDHMVSRLVASLESQRRFVADASHELRTPLTSLKGLSEILVIGAHGNDPTVIEQSAGAIRSELDRLGRLVNDLLTLSRLGVTNDSTATLPQSAYVPMDICGTLGEMTAQMSTIAESRGVRLKKECDTSVWIKGDAGQIKQVLLNLVDNALRYTPDGGEVILRGAIEKAQASAGGANLSRVAKIEVQDTGAGIDPKDLPHIFDRFYRGDVSRTRSTGNSGLGLAIVQGIIEAHQGTIEVTSTLKAGTCFTIRLPLAESQNPSATHTSPAEPPQRVASR